jgi:hypothetical protein
MGAIAGAVSEQSASIGAICHAPGSRTKARLGIVGCLQIWFHFGSVLPNCFRARQRHEAQVA